MRGLLNPQGLAYRMANDYSAIKNALTQTQTDRCTDLQRRTENMKAAEKLSDQGVSITDLVSRLDSLEQKVREMEKPSETVDRSVFRAMESAVKEDSEIQQAKQRLADEKSRVILEACMKDPGYREAYDAYRSKVSEVYVRLNQKE